MISNFHDLNRQQLLLQISIVFNCLQKACCISWLYQKTNCFILHIESKADDFRLTLKACISPIHSLALILQICLNM